MGWDQNSWWFTTGKPFFPFIFLFFLSCHGKNKNTMQRNAAEKTFGYDLL
jgi:hypothetical protein